MNPDRERLIEVWGEMKALAKAVSGLEAAVQGLAEDSKENEARVRSVVDEILERLRRGSVAFAKISNSMDSFKDDLTQIDSIVDSHVEKALNEKLRAAVDEALREREIQRKKGRVERFKGVGKWAWEHVWQIITLLLAAFLASQKLL